MAKPKVIKPPKVGSVKWAEIPEGTFDWDCATREACNLCTLHHTGSFHPWETDRVPGWTGKILALGVSPSWLDGVAGTLFWRAVGEAGLLKEDILISSVLRCNPGPKGPTMAQLRDCRPGVLQLIETLHPLYVLGCGQDVYKSLVNKGEDTGIIALRGRPFDMNGVPVYMTYAPSSINTLVNHQSQGYLYQYLVRDLKRLTDESWALVPHDVFPLAGNMKDEPVLAIDTEFTPESLLDVSFGNDTEAHNYSMVPANDQLTDMPGFVSAQLSKLTWICGHAVVHDIDQLVKQGWCKEDWATGKKILDSMYIAWHTNENRGPKGFKLENVLAQDVTLQGWKQETEGPDPLAWDPEDRAERCRKDAWGCAVIINHNMNDAHGDLEATHRTALTLRRMYHAGAYVDMVSHATMDIELTMAMNYNKEMFSSVTKKGYKKDMDLTNGNHIRDFLFKHRKLKPLGKTPTGLSSVEAQYVDYYAESQPDLIYLSEYLKADKIYSTYVKPLPDKLDEHHWMPVDLGMLTRTGRRHGAFHTWPDQVKPLIRSRYQDGQIYSFDYAKLEVIIVSVLAQEWKLYEYFTKGTGYCGIGEKLLGITVEKDTKEYAMVKQIVLGMVYGLSPWSLAKQLWYEHKVRADEQYEEHESVVKNLVNRYFALFPRLKVYQKAQEAHLLAHQYVVLPDGRRRHLPLPLGRETHAYAHIRNEAINNTVQGTAALLMGTAMVDVEDKIRSLMKLSAVEYHKALLNKDWLDTMLWLEVHDELCADSRSIYNAKFIPDVMTELKTFRQICPQFKGIQFQVEMKEGRHWQ